jgi:CheY-like chemotaxis protein
MIMIEPATVSRKRILLADDQQAVRETVKMLLAIDEHTVTQAADGREALALFTPGRFDLVITDYAMPGMRGDELASNLKQLAPTQPILIITGSAQPVGGLNSAADAILEKPFALDELRRAIAELC